MTAIATYRLGQRPAVIARPPIFRAAYGTAPGETAEDAAQKPKHRSYPYGFPALGRFSDVVLVAEKPTVRQERWAWRLHQQVVIDPAFSL
jgi:hypothetical protein